MMSSHILIDSCTHCSVDNNLKYFIPGSLKMYTKEQLEYKKLGVLEEKHSGWL